MGAGKRPGVVILPESSGSGGPAGARGATDCSKQPQQGPPPLGPLAGVRPSWGVEREDSGRRGREPCPLHAGELPLRVTLWTRWAVREPCTLNESRRVPAPRSPESWGAR